MTSPSRFERVYLRYEDEEKQSSVRVRVNQRADGNWHYELPGDFHHVCPSGECSEVDRVATLLLMA